MVKHDILNSSQIYCYITVSLVSRKAHFNTSSIVFIHCSLVPFSTSNNKQVLDSEWLACCASSPELQTSLHKHLILFRNWNWVAGMWAWVACQRKGNLLWANPTVTQHSDTFALSVHWVILTAGWVNFLQHRCCLFHMEAISEAVLWNEGLAYWWTDISLCWHRRSIL